MSARAVDLDRLEAWTSGDTRRKHAVIEAHDELDRCITDLAECFDEGAERGVLFTYFTKAQLRFDALTAAIVNAVGV